MPKVNWGITAADAQNFDRDKQFAPYRGKTPPNAVYVWKIYRLMFVAGTNTKNPQLRIGLELIPQDASEKAYKGYRIMTFRSVTDRTQFAYVPFLDAIGVSESDFTDRTQADREGNITRIGQWRYTGDELIAGQLKDDRDQDNNLRKDVGWLGPVDDLDDEGDDDPDDDEYADDDDEYADDDSDDDGEDDDYDDEPEPVKPARVSSNGKRRTSRARR